MILIFMRFRKFAKKLLLASQCTSVCLYAPTKKIFSMKNDEYSSEKLLGKLQFH